MFSVGRICPAVLGGVYGVTEGSAVYSIQLIISHYIILYDIFSHQAFLLLCFFIFNHPATRLIVGYRMAQDAVEGGLDPCVCGPPSPRCVEARPSCLGSFMLHCVEVGLPNVQGVKLHRVEARSSHLGSFKLHSVEAGPPHVWGPPSCIV